MVGTTGKIATEKNLLRAGLTPKDFAKNIGDFDGRISVLFGRESSGLTNDELSECDLVVTIPTNKDNPALNLANAVAIVLYELFNRVPSQREQPSKKEKEVLRGFFSIIVNLNFLPRRTSAAFSPAVPPPHPPGPRFII